MSAQSPSSSRYTREQTLALATDRHLVVSAGAGSGKTSVLVERYIQILLSGVDPRHIVAITFTRKAAAEMLTRIGSRLDSRFENATEPHELQLLRHVRERLTNARISTIHSFCSRLLRDFPIEAGVSPNFTDLNESELHTLRQRAVTEVMETWLEDDNHRPRAHSLMLDIDRQTVYDILMSLAANSEEAIRLHEFYRTTTDVEILDRRGIMFRSMLGNALYEQLDALSTLFPHNVEIVKLPKDFAKAQEAYNNLLLSHLHHVSSGNFELFSQSLTALHTVLDSLFTTQNEPRARVAQFIESSGLYYPWDESSTFMAQLRKIVQSLDFSSYDEQLVVHARTLNDMSEHVLSLMNEEKEELSGLDFDDMQQRCLTLLDNDAVRASLRKSIRYLMLDEFQDTNPLQYAIAKKLVDALGSPESIGGTNIFIVGDAKQSIYGFRNADVRVFSEARNDIFKANDIQLQRGSLGTVFTHKEYGSLDMSDDEQHGDIRLNASFRLVPELVAFVNRVCRTIMPAEQQGYEVAYEEMIASRSADTSHSAHIEFIAAQKHRAAGQSSQEAKDRAAHHQREYPSEAELIAQRIDDIVNGDQPLTIADSATVRPIRYSDIAILARKKNIFPKLAQVLSSRGIPYHIHGGQPFFTQPEVQDILSFLEFFHNPANDIALASILRSPFFAFRSSDLYLMNLLGRGETLWEKFTSMITSPQEYIPDYVISAHTTLALLLDIAPHLPIPHLLRRILRQTGWHSIISSSPRAEEMLAHIDHLLHMAREFEGRGFKNLYDFVAELRTMAAISKGNDGPTSANQSNSISLMTIHASKGLEFPVVFLVDTNSSPRTISLFTTNSTIGLCFSQYDDSSKGKVASPLTLAARGIINIQESAEAKRLLYVALTRAKDHLFCSMTIKVLHRNDGTFSISQPTSFAEQLLQSADFDLTVLTNRQSVLTEYIRRSAQDAPFPLAFTVQFATVIQRQSYSRLSEMILTSHNPDLTQPIHSSVHGEIYSASQLMMFLQHPIDYIKRYRLGMPTDEDTDLSAPVSDVSDNDNVQGTLAGTVIHDVLAHIDSWCDEHGILDEEALRERVTIFSNSLSIHLHDKLYERVFSDIQSVIHSPLLSSMLPSVLKSAKEQSLTMPLGNNFLHGTIDMIVYNGEVVEVWDWKTNQVNDERMDALLNQYRTQLQVYSYLVLHAFPEQHSCTSRLVFTRTGKSVALTIHRSELPELTEYFLSIIHAIQESM